MFSFEILIGWIFHCQTFHSNFYSHFYNAVFRPTDCQSDRKQEWSWWAHNNKCRSPPPFKLRRARMRHLLLILDWLRCAPVISCQMSITKVRLISESMELSWWSYFVATLLSMTGRRNRCWLLLQRSVFTYFSAFHLKS